MTYIDVEIGKVKEKQRKLLLKDDVEGYVGLLTTKKTGAVYTLNYEGIAPYPFLREGSKLTLKKGYSVRHMSNFEYVVLKADMQALRTPEPLTA